MQTVPDLKPGDSLQEKAGRPQTGSIKNDHAPI